MSEPVNDDLQIMAEYDFKEPISSMVIINESDDDESPVKANIILNYNNQSTISSDILKDLVKVIKQTDNQKGNATSKKKRSNKKQHRKERERSNYESLIPNEKGIKNNDNQPKKIDILFKKIIKEVNKESNKRNQDVHATSKKGKQLNEVPLSEKSRDKSNESLSPHQTVIPRLEHQTQHINKNQGVPANQSSLNYQALTNTSHQLSYMNRTRNDWQCTSYAKQSQQNLTNTTTQSTTDNTLKNWLSPINNNHTTNLLQNSNVNCTKTIAITAPKQTLDYNQNITTNPIPGQLHQPLAVPQNQNSDDIHAKVLQCVETVSKHLIFIMNAFADYLASQRELAEAAYKIFLETKSYNFKLSFNPIADIYRHKENDQIFMKNFFCYTVDYTIELAKQLNVDCTPFDIDKLCRELFAWVKPQKHPLLSGLLTEQTPLNTQNDKNNRKSASQQWASLTTYDKTIDINLNSTTIMSQENTSVHNLPYQTTMQPRTTETQSPANASSFIQEYQTFSRENNYNLIPPYPSTRQKRQDIRPMQINSSPRNTSPLEPVRSWPNVCAQQHIFLENQSMSPCCYDISQPEHQPCEVIRSRDNRIVYPVNPSQNLMRRPACDQIDPTATLTPLITHVTSLNPSATYIKDGVCLVCSKPTKQMCRGCYKTYYCSAECQAADWRLHAQNCKVH